MIDETRLDRADERDRGRRALESPWLLVSVRAFDSVDPDPFRDVGRALSLFAGLAAVASHVSLGLASLDPDARLGRRLSANRRARILDRGVRRWRCRLDRLARFPPGSRPAVAGRTVPKVVAALWLCAIAGVYGGFVGLVRKPVDRPDRDVSGRPIRASSGSSSA
jgi:hypothetical protein